MSDNAWFDQVFTEDDSEAESESEQQESEISSITARPEDIVTELTSSGWHRASDRRGDFVRLVPPSHYSDVPSLLVPYDRKAADFQVLMDEAARQLARFPQLWQRVVIRSQTGDVDTIWFRKETEAPSGTISWSRGEEFFAAARRMLVAGAKSYIAPYRRYSQKFGQFATRYLDQVLMGQTAPGSYVITALAPVNKTVPINAAAMRSESKYAVDTPAARTITTRIVESVQSTAEALSDFKRRQSDTQGESFLSRIESGVSFDLLTAVLEMIDAGSESSVSVDWSEDAAGVGLPTNLDHHFVFAPRDYPVLEKAAVLLAAEKEPVRIQRTGYVQMMRKPEIGAPTVIAISAVEPNGGRRRYRVRLLPDQLSTAIHAYELDRPVVVTGVAERDGNLWWLYDARIDFLPDPLAAAHVQPSLDED